MELQPTPHAVLPIEGRLPRHVIIGFLLCPGLDVDDMATSLPIPWTMAS